MRISQKLLISILVVLLGFIFLIVIQLYYFQNLNNTLPNLIESQNLSEETLASTQEMWSKHLVNIKYNTLSLLVSFFIFISLFLFLYAKWYISPINKITNWINDDNTQNNKLKKIDFSFGDEINNFIKAYNRHADNINAFISKNNNTTNNLHTELETLSSKLQIVNNKKNTLEENEKENITELRKTNLELKYSNNKILQLQSINENLKLSTQNKSEFLANMSHEIRTPLNAIVGLSQILCKDAEQYNLSNDFLKQLNTIKIAGTNLAEMIDNLLDLSKLEAGKATNHIQKTNFLQLFTAIHQINKTKAQEKKIDFNYNFNKNIPEFLYLERTKVNQVLMNFVSNAIKFTPKGNSIMMNAKMKDGDLLLEVKDEGIGIPKDAQEKIFLPFEQSHDSITSEYGGTGLGLSIAKAIADKLNGKVWVESIENSGSSFFFQFPVSEKPPKGAVEDEQDISFPNYAKDQKILVIEDDNDNLEMLTLLIEKLKLPVHTATNGEDGLAKLIEINPTLVICDLKMPVMNGMTFIKEAKKNQETKHIPVLVLSAVTDESVIKESIKLGFDAFLTKPIQISNIIKYFNKYLNKDKSELIKPSDTLYKSLSELVKHNSFKYQEILETVNKIDLKDKMDENIKNSILKVKKAATDQDMLTIVHNFKQLEKTLHHYSK